jgi:hypothetical protein
MSRTIDYFMWGYQDHFRGHVQVNAEWALKRIDPELSPEVFLVGILQADRKDRFAACVEPEEEHWIESAAFNATRELAGPIREDYVESGMLQSHLLAQQRQDEALYRRSIRDAILKIIDGHERKPEGRTFFASIPELVDGYLVSVVLSVRTDVLNSYHRLKTDKVNIHELRTTQVSRSLIDATIRQILNHASDELVLPEAGLRTLDRDTGEILRAAGRRLAIDCAFRVNRRDGFYGFFESCNAISSLKYEKAEVAGRMLLASRDQLTTRILFKDGISLSNHRRVRKLLELTMENGFLHTDSSSVFGLVDLNEDEKRNEIFEIVFLGHHQWELRHRGELLMQIKFGEPSLPKRISYEPKLRTDLARLLPGITSEDQDRLMSLVSQAEHARHGTLVVISGEAESEAQRLSAEATRISPQLLDADLLGHLTGIDGAVLIDPKGNCQAIGVILDGQATSDGDAARGSRFNSAVRYVHYAIERQIPTVAIIVSEDGDVDIVPNPPPAIKRSSILTAIDELHSISNSEDIPIKRYNELYDWLLKHHFYLLKEDCEQVNRSIQEVEKTLDKPGRTLWVNRHNFKPDPRMDPSFYYLPEE